MIKFKEQITIPGRTVCTYMSLHSLTVTSIQWHNVKHNKKIRWMLYIALSHNLFHLHVLILLTIWVSPANYWWRRKATWGDLDAGATRVCEGSRYCDGSNTAPECSFSYNNQGQWVGWGQRSGSEAKVQHSHSKPRGLFCRSEEFNLRMKLPFWSITQQFKLKLSIYGNLWEIYGKYLILE